MASVFGDFFESPEGQTIAGAHKYLSAAKELRYSSRWMARLQLLQTPTIHLMAHGVELLLKYPLLAQGIPPEQVARKYGHDLVKLWNDDAVGVLRSIVFERAVEAWEEARSSKKWQGNDFSGEPRAVLKGALEQLAFLHGRDSGFALRYVVAPNTWAPRPAFLIDVFGWAAERGTMDPNFLLEGR